MFVAECVKCGLSIPLNGFHKFDCALALSGGSRPLSIPLNGFPRYRTPRWAARGRRWQSFNSIEWIRLYELKVLLTKLLSFQFHWMDSWCLSVFTVAGGRLLPFNSIEWILATLSNASIGSSLFQFHWMDSRRKQPIQQNTQRNSFQFHWMDSRLGS